jgi:peptidyl-prolyl cis-trans isomerase D
MLKAMRKLTKQILWIVIAAFVGTIIFAWGMEFSGKKGQRKGMIATVNGEDIQTFAFQYYYDQALRRAEKEQGDIDEEAAARIRDDVYNSMVNEILFRQEAQKRGIEISDAELYEYMRRYPPEEIRQHPAFQTPEGKFDYQKYLQALGDPRVPWGQVEATIRPNLRLSRLQQAVTSLVRVTDGDVKQYYQDQGEKVKIKYVYVPSLQFQNKDLAVSQDQVQAYYQSHQQEFKVDPSADLSYVEFDKAPSDQDVQEVKQRILEIKQELDQGQSFADLAMDYSEDPASADSGGNLGWFGKGAMVPEFEQAAFSMKPGEVSDPIQTQFGWHLIQVEEKRGSGDKEEVKARHILLQIKPSETTITLLKEGADNFLEQESQSGFSEAAKDMNLEVQETGWFTQRGTIRNLGDNAQVKDFAFGNDEGKTSDVIETARAFYVFQVKGRKPAGISPLTEVEPTVRQKLIRAIADSLAFEKARSISAQIDRGESLKKAAEDNGAKFAETQDFSRSGFISGVGNPPELIGTAFGLTQPGQISQPVKTNLGSFIVELVSRIEPSDSVFTAEKDSLSLVVLQKMQSQVYQDWFAQVRKEANIQDYRSEYFREY